MRRGYAALFVLAYVVLGIADASAASRPIFCNTTDPVHASELTTGVRLANCDLRGRVVTMGGLGVTVPDHGGITVSASSGADPEQGPVPAATDLDEFTVVVENGMVRALPGGGPQASRMPQPALNGHVAQARDNGCTDNASNWRFRFNQGMDWEYNRSTEPAYLAGKGQGVVRAGALNLGDGYNNCGFRQVVFDRLRLRFAGTTTYRANIRGNDCGAYDGPGNIVDWGSRPPTSAGVPLGIACWWFVSNPGPGDPWTIVSAHIRFHNAAGRFYTGHRAARCDDQWSLQGVAVHEFGHAFGLGHVDENAHPWLTMSPTLMDCDDSQQSLGRGDYNVLNAHYG